MFTSGVGKWTIVRGVINTSVMAPKSANICYHDTSQGSVQFRVFAVKGTGIGGGKNGFTQAKCEWM